MGSTVDRRIRLGRNGGYLKGGAKSKQLFISTGLTISYSYNNISFVIVPAGWDFDTSLLAINGSMMISAGGGFGIAVSPTIFATMLNK